MDNVKTTGYTTKKGTGSVEKFNHMPPDPANIMDQPLLDSGEIPFKSPVASQDGY